MPLVCTPDNLAELAKCFVSLSQPQREAIKTYLLAVEAGVDPDPEALMASAKCFTALSVKELLQIQTALLCLLNGGVVPAVCRSLSGDAPPTGSVTPEFIGQLYNRNNGEEFYYSTGLTNADWTLIPSGGPAGGLVWGPDATELSAFFKHGIENMIGFGVKSLSFPSLTLFTGADDFFDIASSNQITSLSLPVLVSVEGGSDFIFMNCNALLSFSAPLLQTVEGSLDGSGCGNLASVDLSSLTSVGLDLNLFNIAVTTLDLSSLVTVPGTLNLQGDTALTSLDLSSLVTTTAALITSGSLALTSILIPNWIPTDGSFLDFGSCALDATSVQLILRRCVLAGVTTCTITLTGGTNAGLASLSAQGQTDFATLFGAGNTITINP